MARKKKLKNVSGPTAYQVIKIEGRRKDDTLFEVDMPFEILADGNVIASTYTMNDAVRIIKALQKHKKWKHTDSYDDPEAEWESTQRYDIDVMRGEGKMVINKMEIK